MKKKRRRNCRVSWCKNKNLEARGYCAKHYKQMLRHGCIFKSRFDPNEFVEYVDKIGILIVNKSRDVITEAFVDKEEVWVKEYKWHLRGKKNYVATYSSAGKQVYLHRFFYPDSVQVDHIDGNPLNNCKSNLRPCNNAQNSWNTGIMSHNTSGITGVHFCNTQNRWISKIGFNKRTIFLGQFVNFEDAIKVRKEAEKKYFGDFSPNINLKENRMKQKQKTTTKVK